MKNQSFTGFTLSGELSPEQARRLLELIRTDEELFKKININEKKWLDLERSLASIQQEKEGDDIIKSIPDLMVYAGYNQLNMDNMLEGYQILGFNWEYIYVNEVAAKQARYTKQFLEGKSMPEVFPGIRETALFARLKMCMEKGQNDSFVSPFAYPDGSTSWFNLRVHPVPEGLLMLSTDITEIRTTNELLKKSEADYFQLFMKNPQPMWIYNISTLKFLEVNEAAIKHYGYTSEEFRQMSVLDVRPESERQKFMDTFGKKLGGYSLSGEWKHRKKNGEIIDVEISSFDVLFKEEEARHVMIIDITQRKKTEEQIRLSEERFRALVENGHDAILIRNKDFRLTYFSPGTKRMLGYGQEEEPDLDREESYHPDDWGYIQQLKNELLNNPGKAIAASLRRFHKNGNIVCVEGYMTNLLHVPAVKGIISNFIDVTERKKQEASLAKNQLYLEMAQTVGKTGHRIFEWSRGQVEPTVTWSKNLYKLHGLEENASIDAKLLMEMIHPDDRQPVTELIMRAYFSNQPQECDYRITRPDGTMRLLNGKLFPLPEEDGKKIVFGISQDITEKKLAEEKIRQSQNLLAGYFNNTSEAICIIDRKKKILTHNRVFENMCMPVKTGGLLDNYKLETQLQPAFYSILEDKISKALKGETINCDVLVPQREKTEWWSLSVKPVRDNRYSISSIVIVLQNIDEKRCAEEELRISNERYLYMTKATSDAIWDWDVEIDVLYRGDGFKTLFGYNKKDFSGKMADWNKLIHPEDLERVELNYKKLLDEGGDIWLDEYRYKKANGEYAYVIDTGLIIRGSDGKIARMVGAMQDITRRKKEEQRLKMLEAVVMQTSDMVLITEATPSGPEGRKTVYVNDAFCRTTGYSKEEFLGKNPKLLQGALSDKKAIERLKNAISSWSSCEIETVNYSKEKVPYWVEMSIMPITNEKGEYTHWVAVQKNVTERKKKDEEKRQLIKELTKNNKELRQFSYITSHNLRAPLTNLLAIIELTKKFPAENKTLQKLLDGFAKSTYHLNDTLNDLLNILVIKENTNIVNAEVKFSTTCTKTEDSIKTLIEKSGAEIITDFSAIDTIQFNPVYLESIFMNLLINSLRYADPVRKPFIEIRTSIETGQPVMRFSDNGLGMDMNRVRDKIFGLYQKFHHHPESKGIGLYLVHAQVTAMGGSIEVDSKENEGTMFTIKFKPIS